MLVPVSGKISELPPVGVIKQIKEIRPAVPCQKPLGSDVSELGSFGV